MVIIQSKIGIVQQNFFHLLLTYCLVLCSDIALFSDQNDASRRRREANYDNVYVEQFVYLADGKTSSTNVIFAVAEKPSYDLIPASDVCELLKETDVKCTSDSGNTSADRRGNGGGDSEFPLV